MVSRNFTERGDVTVDTSLAMFEHCDTTRTPSFATAVIEFLRGLPEGWTDSVPQVSIPSKMLVNGQSVLAISDKDFRLWDDLSDARVTSSSIPAFRCASSACGSTENQVFPTPFGVRIEQCALPTVVDTLSALAKHAGTQDRQWISEERLAWWESQLPALRNRLASYVRKRLPGRQADHDDLISETFLSFCEQLKRHPMAFPRAWFQPIEPASERDRTYLQQLLIIILRRRIFDLFRAETREWSKGCIESFDDLVASGEPNSEQQALYSAMLGVVVNTLVDLTEGERDILALVSGIGSYEKTLRARDRQRLKRARSKLAGEIRRRFGDRVSDLLTEKS